MTISKENLRFEFVEMLFALAIGEVAVEISQAIYLKIGIRENPHIYSHLLLGALIIVLSWIGWQNSKSKGSSLEVESVFSFSFIILLLDILLVTCYFIIVKGAEFNAIKGTTDITPDISLEIIWTLRIFFIYLVWDFVTKFIEHGISKTDSNVFKKHVKVNFQDFWNRTWPTLICILIAFIFYFFQNGNVTKEKALVVDFSLIALFFLFRGLKPDSKNRSEIKREDASLTQSELFTEGVEQITIIDPFYYWRRGFAIIIPILIIIIGFIYMLK